MDSRGDAETRRGWFGPKGPETIDAARCRGAGPGRPLRGNHLFSPRLRVNPSILTRFALLRANHRNHPPLAPVPFARVRHGRSEEHTSELQSLMRISYAVFCLKKKKKTRQNQ